MLRTKENVKLDLASLAPAFIECVRGGLQDYVEKYKETRAIHTKRSQSSLIHDHVVARCLDKFGTLKTAEGDCALHSKGNLRLLVVQLGKYKIRLKKHDARHVTRNIPTQAVLEFRSQQPSFEQIPPSTNLALGYVLTSDASFIDATVLVTMPIGNRAAWSWVLEEVKTTLPVREAAQVLPLHPKKSRVRPKKQQVPKTPKEKPRKAEGEDGGAE
jgi:hypothetical protein